MTFEQNCKSCHARELEFDVYHVLGPAAAPRRIPRIPRTIHEYIVGAYRAALAANPGLARRPLGTDLAPVANAAAWLERVTRDSEQYLFARKCGYCHQTAGDGVVRNVNRVAGRYVEGKPEGAPVAGARRVRAPLASRRGVRELPHSGARQHEDGGCADPRDEDLSAVPWRQRHRARRLRHAATSITIAIWKSPRRHMRD